MNFFVVFSSILAVGLATTFMTGKNIEPIGVTLGLLLIFNSFIFWKFDERNKFLTKHGEAALLELEKHFSINKIEDGTINPIKIFTSEKSETLAYKEANAGKRIYSRMISHSKCLNLLFFIYGLLGAIGVITSIIIALYY